MITVYHHSDFLKYDFCREEWLKGTLTPVAEVDTDDADEAFQLTNHIDSSWLENEKVKPLVEKARSTSVGDVLVTGKKTLVCEAVGWREMKREEYKTLRTTIVANTPRKRSKLELNQRFESSSEKGKWLFYFPLEYRSIFRYCQGTLCPCGRNHHDITVLRDTVPEDSLYRRYMPVEGACFPCLQKTEEEFIQQMPLEDFPLWVEHVWIFAVNHDLYQERIQGGSK